MASYVKASHQVQADAELQATAEHEVPPDDKSHQDLILMAKAAEVENHSKLKCS